MAAAGDRLYEGCLKSFSPKDGYGFIACPALKVTYGRDVYIHRSKVPDGASSGCALQFTIGLNKKGQPQAQTVTLMRHSVEDLGQAAAFIRTDLFRFESVQPAESGAGATSAGEYSIAIVRKQGQRLGVDVDDDSLIIDKVTGGAFAEWNHCHPHMKVKPGDCIMQVNDVFGDVRGVLEECRSAQTLEIRIQRAKPGTSQVSVPRGLSQPEPGPAPNSAVAPSLCVLSWNILAGAYANMTAYRDVDPKVLVAQRRRVQVAAIFAQLAVDVVCLQEVDCPMEDLGLTADFDCVSAQRPDGRCDRCVIAWRRDRLEMGNAGWREVQFDAHPPPAFHRSHLDHASGNVGLAVELRFRQDLGRRCVTICTTHLCWQPEKVDIRHWQLHTLLSVGRSLGGPRVVICGDLNAVPGSAPVTFLSEGCRLQSAYEDVQHTALTNSNACSVNGPFAAMIDYIFYTPAWLTLLSRISLPTASCLKAGSSGGTSRADGPVPTLLSPTWPSDHVMLGAVLLLTNPSAGDVDLDNDLWD